MVSSSSTSTCTYITDGPGPNERYRCTSYVPRDHGDEDTHTHTHSACLSILCASFCASDLVRTSDNGAHALPTKMPPIVCSSTLSLPPSLRTHTHTRFTFLIFHSRVRARLTVSFFMLFDVLYARFFFALHFPFCPLQRWQ